MVVDVMFMVVVPLFIGFGVRHYLKEKIEKILPVFPAISVTFIIFICSLVIALNKERLAEVTAVVLMVGVILSRSDGGSDTKRLRDVGRVRCWIGFHDGETPQANADD